jgi:hypothetical protein
MIRFPAFPNSNFMSVLPQITYDNMALIFLSHFHGYNKNEKCADYWDILGAPKFAEQRSSTLLSSH